MGELAELMPAANAAIDAVAVLHHAWFTGLILTIASRDGADVVGDWVRRTFRRQHEAKFLASFAKLGLDGLDGRVGGHPAPIGGECLRPS